ncbi:hypothetical protein C289_0450 [Anoxybacillus ayderensis]|uniref:ATP-binding cassette domain-containing protein n=1 Tax=Anoxybacillus ayderensis TaxID=265546 RepID=UPI0003855FB5|nr:ABC transporter ATP-binding protein [Anoxybacillus ayderensis]EPZ39468.1 hypothetical protein C289_0450 [Anoxybacillus ayderensis]
MNKDFGLIVNNFTKIIQGKKIFDKAQLCIENGQIVHLGGENGVGKTTFLNCLAGYDTFEEGDIFIEGHNFRTIKREVLRELICFVPSSNFSFCDLLTPTEYFLFVRKFFRKSNHSKEKELIERLCLEPHINKQIFHLSFGTKKKVVFLAALLACPRLLVCDEIFEGLDYNSVEEVKKIILERKKNGYMTIFTTHMKGGVTDMVDRSYIIKEGKILGMNEN